MINNYKKGDVLLVNSISTDGHTVRNIGIFLEKSNLEIVLAHNFSDTTPIDFVKISIKDINKIEKIIPVEINSLDQLNNFV